jgi:hypothetical protein
MKPVANSTAISATESVDVTGMSRNIIAIGRNRQY